MKWRDNAWTLIRLMTRFMDSMKQLQKAVQKRKTASEDEISNERHTFEGNKRELEQIMIKIQSEIDESKLEVIRQGDAFGIDQEPESVRSKTQQNLNKLTNILKFSSNSEKRAASKPTKPANKRKTNAGEMTAVIDPEMNILNDEMLESRKLSEVPSRDEADAVRIVCPPSIEHFKP